MKVQRLAESLRRGLGLELERAGRRCLWLAGTPHGVPLRVTLNWAASGRLQVSIEPDVADAFPLRLSPRTHPGDVDEEAQTRTGDPAFDARYMTWPSSRSRCLALLDQKMRSSLLHIGPEIDGSELYWWGEVRANPKEVLQVVTELARLVAAICNAGQAIPERLARIAAHDPIDGVRAEALKALIEAYPEHEVTAPCLAQAKVAENSELRLVAGRTDWRVESSTRAMFGLLYDRTMPLEARQSVLCEMVAKEAPNALLADVVRATALPLPLRVAAFGVLLERDDSALALRGVARTAAIPTELRCEALQTLLDRGGGRLLASLLERLLRRTHGPLFDLVLEGFGVLGRTPGLSTLATRFKSLDPLRRISTIQAVCALADPGAEAVLIQCLEDADPTVRRAVICALGEHGSAGALTALLACRQASKMANNGRLRGEFKVALRRIKRRLSEAGRNPGQLAVASAELCGQLAITQPFSYPEDGQLTEAA